ncbi:MAG: hypothetical protein LW854_18010 [Rubrivivax sp.]|nr:hypothetical protein [Rubrivivax sp.]
MLALRHLAGDAAAIDEVLTAHSLPPLPGPGACLGDDPWQLWTGPAEMLLVTSNGPLADGVLAALRPGCHRLACAVDQSAGSLVFDMRGAGLDDLLSRLLDASAIPGHAGLGVRARLMDISAVILRVGQDRALLVVDRALGGYAAQWIGHAWHAGPG